MKEEILLGGGLNAYNPEIVVEKGEVVWGSKNFYFERGVARSRDGLSALPAAYIPASLSAGLFRFGKPFKVQASASSTTDWGAVVMYGNGAIGFDDGSGSLTLLYPASGTDTSDGISPLCGMAQCDMVNGSILVGGYTTGLRRWVADHSGPFTTTRIAAAPYRYVAGHRTRAIAAYALPASGAPTVNPRKVAWSVDGDETNFTSAGSGSTTLADSAGEITGVAVIRDTLVVARSDGFTFGYLTGSSSPVYNWLTHSKNSIGCTEASTFAYDSNACYFVSNDDVYRFDLVDMVKIGQKAQPKITRRYDSNSQTLLYCGFIAESSGNGANLQEQFPCRRYHLISNQATGISHFAYDIDEERWSYHDYDDVTLGGYFNGTMTLIAFYDGAVGTETVSYFNSETACERGGVLKTPVVILGDPDSNTTVQGMSLEYNNKDGSAIDCTVDVDSTADGPDLLEREGAISLFPNSGWRRGKIGLRSSGNYVQTTITVPANHHLELSRLRVQYEPTGEQRT